VLRERDEADFVADFVVRFAAVRPFAGAFAAVREDVLRDVAGFAAERVPFFAAGFAAALPAVFVAVRPEAARVDVLRLDDFAADFAADFAFARVAGFAADFAAVRPLADAAFVADFAAVRVLAAAFFAVDLAADAFFAVADFALDVFALAAAPRADDERVVVLFDVLLFAVLRDAGFFAPAADELRELDDREDERVAAAIVRVSSARPWITSPIVASPHVASAISPPWVINESS
jgi:hypothetical protein